jgi:hypothetical protein
MFEIKFFTLLVFIVINFVIIFFVKTRTTTVISLIISHLIAILLLSNIVSSYEIFKEFILSLTIYSICLLFLISNYKQNNSNSSKPSKIKGRITINSKLLATFAIISFISLGMFFISKNISVINKEIVSKTLVVIDSDTYKKEENRKLSDNFLLKKSCDIILLIVASSSILLILLKKES